MPRSSHRRVRIDQVLKTICAGAVGGGLGLILQLISKFEGRQRWVITGVLLGLGVFWLSTFLRGRHKELELSEVKLSIPKFSQFTFLVNAEYRRVAWKLFVETTTRISTQPLGAEEGFLKEALASLYGLFQTTRDLLKGMEPSRDPSDEEWSVEMFAISMLNDVLRPFLAKWHPLLSEFEKTGKNESEWDGNAACRSELEEVRRELLAYARGFGELAGVANLDYFIVAPSIQRTQS